MKAQDLKNSVLQLAIQGKLVEQNPNDEPASVLLEKIKAEKEKLIKEKKIKREKPLPEISEEEKDFDLPLGWSWCRLSDITHSLTLNDGDWILSKDMSQNGEIKLIQLGSIGDGKYINKGFKNISYNKFIELKCREINEGDILINRLLGKKMLACILPKIEGIKITSVDTCFIRENPRIYNQKFILYMVLSGYFQRKVYTKVAGTTRQRISKGNLINIIFPLPPLEEQKRIVAKIEEVLEKIEEYDKAEKELSALEKAFPQDMKKSILQYAIQGKLVEQNPEDEPASVLLEKIKSEKEQLIKEKKIKREKALPEISEEEKPFEIPDGWKWVRLGELGANELSSIVDGPFGSSINVKNDYISSGIPVVRMLNIKPMTFIEKNFKYVSREKFFELSRHNVVAGDVLFAKVGAGIGECCVVPNSFNEGLLATTGVCRFRVSKVILPEYLCYYLLSQVDNFKKISSKTAQPFLNMTTIRKFVCPLPPIKEQKRIVDRIEKIMDYLEELQHKMNDDLWINRVIKVKPIDAGETKKLINN